jgi:hypothetical protein
MRLPDRIQDLIVETRGQRAIERRIAKARRTDPDAAEIFTGPPRRFGGAKAGDRRDTQILRYAEVKSAKGEIARFHALFD